jgi:cephalosporin-C deacetylase-like acetyl esterase
VKKFVCLISSLFLLSLLTVPIFAQDATSEATEETPMLPELFEYDTSAPLDMQDAAPAEDRDGVTVRDITYVSPGSDTPIAAYLVLPPGDEPHAAILYTHWYERGAPNANRTQFVDEAVEMAREYGVMSLHVETMWSDPDWYTDGRTLDSDYGDAINQVINFRRGLDVLLAQPNVDASRVGYVGHDFGAMYGALLSGVEERVSAYVFIAGASDFNQWMLFGVDEENTPGIDDYKAKMATIAPTVYVAQTAPASILFQFGSNDFYTPQEDYLAFYNAASSPKELMVYESEHPMEAEEIRENRITFLVDRLKLEGE